MGILHNERCLPGSKCDAIVIILRQRGNGMRKAAHATATNSENYTKSESQNGIDSRFPNNSLKIVSHNLNANLFIIRIFNF